MRKMFLKYASVLLVLWYSLSIIGFDVHSCKTTGEVFVASLVGGVTCEDIHPEHSCKSHGGCCSHNHSDGCCAKGHHSDHAGSRVEKADCCSNDLQVLQLTGVNVSENENIGDSVYHCFMPFDVDLLIELIKPSLQRPLLKYLEHPDSWVFTPDRQAFFSIWRV